MEERDVTEGELEDLVQRESEHVRAFFSERYDAEQHPLTRPPNTERCAICTVEVVREEPRQ